MSASDAEKPPVTRASAATRPLDERAQWRQFGLITVVAVAIYAGLRMLPTGTDLNHMDFRVQGGNAIEFCDPLNPQFIPVVTARSPVSLQLRTLEPPQAGNGVQGTLTLRTASGKPIAPPDLLVVHTRPLHLMLVDPSLQDYQHVHPEPGANAGEWLFSFTPRRAGAYRLFADFTPAATARGLYASADLAVEGGARADAEPAGPRAGGRPAIGTTTRHEGFDFTLSAGSAAIRAGRPIDFVLSIARPDGAPVPLEPVMDAYAHLVAFDETRSGFAHLHPMGDPLARPDPLKPVLAFKLTIPSAGRYVIWTQVKLSGKETFVPFWFEIAE